MWPKHSGTDSSLSKSQLQAANASPFIAAVLDKLNESWKEVLQNPLTAAQNSLLSVAYLLTAVCLSIFKDFDDAGIRSKLEKISVPSQLFSLEPKPSFLLNTRVYTKVTNPEDLIWSVRALAAASSVLDKADVKAQDAWSQAFLYVLTASNIPTKLRRDAAKTLSGAWSASTATVGTAIIRGLWVWLQSLDDKDSAAAAAKTGNRELHLAIHAICRSAHR